jgi:hypothetical protein
MVAPRCSVQTHSVARCRRRAVAPHRCDVVDCDRVIAIVAKQWLQAGTADRSCVVRAIVSLKLPRGECDRQPA